jgi:type II secretory pathway component GspD/PulD (secretin)
VEKAKAKQNSIPVVGPDEPYTTNEQMLTRLFKVRYADLEPLRGVVQQLVSQNGDTIPFQPDTLIVNDIGSNMHRLERIIEQLDSRSSSDEMRVIQIRYANANDLATTIQKLFDAKANRPGARPTSPSAARGGSTSTRSRTPTPRTSRRRCRRWPRARRTGRAAPEAAARSPTSPARHRRRAGREEEFPASTPPSCSRAR